MPVLYQFIRRFKEWFQYRRKPTSTAEMTASLKRFTQSPLGELIFDEQRKHLDEQLAPMFGYHFLELSPFPVGDLSRVSRINHRSLISPMDNPCASAKACFSQLPIPNESVDVVLLHHALDYSEHPHQVLREASRVLIARGHLVVVGFNPVSWMGLWRVFLQYFSTDGFWKRNSLSSHRVKDWLHLLELETVSTHQGFYRLPVSKGGMLAKTAFLEVLCRSLGLPVGGYYILVARKDRVGVTPIKPLWRTFNPVKGMGVGKPSVSMQKPGVKKQEHG